MSEYKTEPVPVEDDAAFDVLYAEADVKDARGVEVVAQGRGSSAPEVPVWASARISST